MKKLNLSSTVFRRTRTSAFCRKPIISLTFFILLNGCTLEPIAHLDEHQPVVPINAKKTSTNKSYKVKGKTYKPIAAASGYKANGIASWYGAKSGKRTASGERFNPLGLTAAHKTLPISSKVRVTNLRNGRYVDVIINDRGPFVENRLIDLSKGAAKQIGMDGLTEVSVEHLDS